MDVTGCTIFVAASIAWQSSRLLAAQYRRYVNRSHIVVSEDIDKLISRMERLIQRDEGNRGIKDILMPEGELQSAAWDLVVRKYVTIITGFPCMLKCNPPTETDGPLGSFCLASTLLKMDKHVTVLTDQCNEEVILACAAASNLAQHGHNFSLESFPPNDNFDHADCERWEEIKDTTDIYVAIERAGPNKEGQYLTMRGYDMSRIVAPLDRLLKQQSDDNDINAEEMHKSVRSIGIGITQCCLYGNFQ